MATMILLTMMMVMMGTWQHRPQDRNADVGGVELERVRGGDQSSGDFNGRRMKMMMIIFFEDGSNYDYDSDFDEDDLFGGVKLEREGEIGSAETSTDGAVENSVCSQKSACMMLELG